MRRRLFQVNAEQVEWHEVEHSDVSLVYLPLLILSYSIQPASHGLPVLGLRRGSLRFCS
jgi:hypothetical protein